MFILTRDEILTTGRKERIMIACVTFETTKVTDPVKFYESTRVHIIHFAQELPTSEFNIYEDFYNRVCEIINDESNNSTEIINHNEKVSDFTVMLRTILNIIKMERIGCEDCDIYVNISAGSSEYAAAAAIASMMSPGTIPFSVNTETYTIIGEDDLKKAYYRNEKPVGLTKTVRSPKTLPCYSIEMPMEHLVRALRILNERNAKKLPVSSGKMSPVLKDAGIWYRESKGIGRSDHRQSDAVNYHRDFVTKWIDLGWVKKDELRKRFIVTEKGKNVIDTFHVDDIPSCDSVR